MHSEVPLLVESLPGGFTVTEADDEKHWWSVCFHGSHPSITSYQYEHIPTYTRLGRHIMGAIRAAVRP